MTIYLTKKESGKIFHFRATLTDVGIDIVEGQFYSWISKISNYENSGDLHLSFQKLIDKKIKEGFRKVKYELCKENDYDVYDKAKYHSDGNFPEELDQFQSFVHTGMYVGWLIDNGLLNSEFTVESRESIREFKNRNMSGAQFYETEMDGVLILNDISEIGNQFSFDYFDFDSGLYLKDYEQALATDLPTLYHVEDSWENYDKIKKLIDKRFDSWYKERNAKSWWKLW